MTEDVSPLSLDQIQAQLHDAATRWTFGKAAVVQALMEHGGHLSSPEVLRAVNERFPGMRQSTVHRILITLLENRLVHVLGRAGEARHGMARPAHHHLVCDRCGTTTDLPVDVLDAVLATASQSTGFRFDAASLTLNGICHGCQGVRRQSAVR